MKIIAVLGAALSLSACSFVERPYLSKFYVPTSSSFEYDVETREVNEHEPEEEQERIDWLEDWLKYNKTCPEGYTIDSRKYVATNQLMGRVYYRGRCKESSEKQS